MFGTMNCYCCGVGFSTFDVVAAVSLVLIAIRDNCRCCWIRGVRQSICRVRGREIRGVRSVYCCCYCYCFVLREIRGVRSVPFRSVPFATTAAASYLREIRGVRSVYCCFCCFQFVQLDFESLLYSFIICILAFAKKKVILKSTIKIHYSMSALFVPYCT